MMSKGSSADKSKRSLGHYQFSLAQLLVLMTLCCLLMGLITWRSRIPTIALAVTALICLVYEIRHRRWANGIVAMVICLMMMGLIAPSIWTGSGSNWFVVPIRVVDAATGKAVARAEVRRIRHVTGGNAQAPAAWTARDGLVNLAVRMRCHSCSYHFFVGPAETRRTIDVSGELEITADGYEPVRIRLAEQLGTDQWDRDGPGFLEIRVELHGKAAAPPPADDAKGPTKPISVKKSGKPWCTVVIAFEIKDQSTNKPIRDVLVRVVPKQSASNGHARTATTDSEGLAQLAVELPLSDRLSDNGGKVATLESVDVTGAVLEVKAEGYRPVQAPLAKYVGREWELFRWCPGEVLLVPDKTEN